MVTQLRCGVAHTLTVCIGELRRDRAQEMGRDPDTICLKYQGRCALLRLNCSSTFRYSDLYCVYRVLNDQMRLGHYSIRDVNHVQSEPRLQLLGGG